MSVSGKALCLRNFCRFKSRFPKHWAFRAHSTVAKLPRGNDNDSDTRLSRHICMCTTISHAYGAENTRTDSRTDGPETTETLDASSLQVCGLDRSLNRRGVLESRIQRIPYGLQSRGTERLRCINLNYMGWAQSQGQKDSARSLPKETGD